MVQRRSGGAAAFALACALLLAGGPVGTRALGGFPMPQGVDQAAFSKLIPLFTSTLTTCGNSSTLIDAFNLFASQQEFINRSGPSFLPTERPRARPTPFPHTLSLPVKHELTFGVFCFARRNGAGHLNWHALVE